MTRPVGETVATAGLEETQLNERPVSTVPLASRAIAWSCSVWPVVRDALGGVTVMEAMGMGRTLKEPEPDLPSLVAVIVAVPIAAAVTSPAGDTLATPGLDEDQRISRPLSARPSESRTEAVNWAVRQGAKVINISFVYVSEQCRDLFKAAINDAINRDVVVVAAVGNNNTPERKNPTPYPAAWTGVVGVGAVASNGDRLPQSGVGDFVAISAPGAEIIVPRPISGYGLESGTSFAAPLVAATAALIFQRFPGIKAKEVIRRLLATADPAPGGRRSSGYGAGIVNPVRAVTEVIDDAAPVPPRALGAPAVDPVQARAAAEQARLRERALWVSAIGIVAALLAVALMIALPAGIRRKWRPAGE